MKTEAQKRAQKNWYKRLKEKGLCTRNCKRPAGFHHDGRPRTICVECTKEINSKNSYAGKVNRLLKRNRVLTKEVEKLHKIVRLQKVVIQQLRESKNGRC